MGTEKAPLEGWKPTRPLLERGAPQTPWCWASGERKGPRWEGAGPSKDSSSCTCHPPPRIPVPHPPNIHPPLLIHPIVQGSTIDVMVRSHKRHKRPHGPSQLITPALIPCAPARSGQPHFTDVFVLFQVHMLTSGRSLLNIQALGVRLPEFPSIDLYWLCDLGQVTQPL